MIVDCCLYAGESGLFELRVRTLRHVVDLFMPVTCRLTHQGELTIVDRWEPPDDLADVALFGCCVNAETLPEAERGGVGSPWYQFVERAHRDGILNACDAAEIPDDALVLVSDVDEIPDPTSVPHLGTFCDANTATGWTVLQQRFHSTALNLLHPAQPWLGTCAARRRDLAPQAMRDARGDYKQMAHAGPGGWHLSWFGTDDERQRKLDTFSHAELRGHWDPARARVERQHSNGEQLIELSLLEMVGLDWPEPLVDESFTVPDSWWSPGWRHWDAPFGTGR